MKDRIDVRLTPTESKKLRLVATQLKRSKADTIRVLIEKAHAAFLAEGLNPPTAAPREVSVITEGAK